MFIKTIQLSLISLFISLSLSAATVTINCTATVQSIGACAASDAGKSGVLIAYWVSSIDDAPGDPDTSSNAIDLRDALCARFSIPPGNCTAAAADGALRKLLVLLVENHRHSKKVVAVPVPTTPVLDGQGNP